MIQEKDFLYRVPIKTAPITTPGGQIRNPEILVDIEGGEFMHGNIFDANSTNKLVNQSVKDAIDKNIADGSFVTKDLLDKEVDRATKKEDSLSALIQDETNARSSKDTELENSIAEEKTRAQGKEKEISDKLAIVNGDSNTEGSFRKAIADVIAAAPEDLDTLKEIADKLAGNDDLHTALNQAITEKADASALANEVTRATSAESDLQAAIDTKADAIALSNYVLTTTLNQQVDTLNTAINAKQDAGNYIPYDSTNTSKYKIDKDIGFENEQGYTQIGFGSIFYSDTERINSFSINPQAITFGCNLGQVIISPSGISLRRDDNAIITIDHSYFSNKYFDISGNYIKIGESGNRVVEIDNGGIKFNGVTENLIPKATGGFIDISNYATRDFVTAGLSAKQNKITVNSIDVTDIETADVTKLRTIVNNLITALISSGLINATSGIE